MKHSIGAWISAFRPPAQINLALPMLVGLSQRVPCDSRFSCLVLIQTLFISLLLQAMILYSNEASDARTDDPAARTMISGGAGIGASGVLSVVQLRRAAIIAGAAGFLVCTAIGGWLAAKLWVIAAVLVWLYDGQTLQLSRRPVGCMCQAVGVGIVTPMLGAGSQAVWPGFLDLVAGFALGLAGFILTALPDESADRKVGKRTLVVVWGARKSFALMLVLLMVAAILLMMRSAPRSCPPILPGGWLSQFTLVVIGGALMVTWVLGRRSSRAMDTPGEWLAGAPGDPPRMFGMTSINAALWLAGSIAALLWLLWAFG